MVIHNTFSVETLLLGFGYTPWTPLKGAPELANIPAALDGRDPVDDANLILVSEEGRLVIRLTGVLDGFHLRERPGTTRKGNRRG
jgi:hypothetical protein